MRKRPDHAIGLRPRIPQQPTEFCSRATELHTPSTNIPMCRPADKVTRRFCKARRTLRRARSLLRLGHAILQHDLEHGQAHPQCPALLRPVRTQGDRRAGPGQDRRFETQRALGRRPGSPRLPEHGQEARGRAGGSSARPKNLRRLSAARFDRRTGGVTRPGRDWPRPRTLANGTTIPAGRFMVGPLAHILKNRFYIGEIAYRGEVHRGAHAPILDRELFEAVQAKLAERTVQRKLTRCRSSAILAGLIVDDRGNPMSPSHANKKGVRYRYYVSQALLQSRKTEAGFYRSVIGARCRGPHLQGSKRGAANRSGDSSDQQ